MHEAKCIDHHKTHQVSPSPGDVISNRFELVSVIGRGGGGIVFKARQVGVGRDVALKVLTAENQIEGAAVRRFEREARIISRLSHPNTVTLFEYNSTERGLLYFAMEFVDGVQLKSVLERERKLSPQRSATIIKQMLKSLAEAHGHGVVHRDLKPANIMLCDFYGERDFVKVLDFGVATVFEADQTAFKEDVTMTADVVGTPKYMAPEQFRSNQLTPASDLYALACIWFEMLVGYCPFDGETLHVTIAKHLFQEPPSLPAEFDRFGSLREILDKLLRKEPSERYQSAQEVLQAIDKWERESTSFAPPAGRVKPRVLTPNRAQYTPQGPIHENTNQLGLNHRYGHQGLLQSPSMTPNQPVNVGAHRRDTDPNILVIPAPAKGSQDGRKWILLGLVFFALILGVVAVLLLVHKKNSDKVQGTDTEESVPSPVQEQSTPAVVQQGELLNPADPNLSEKQSPEHVPAELAPPPEIDLSAPPELRPESYELAALLGSRGVAVGFVLGQLQVEVPATTQQSNPQGTVSDENGVARERSKVTIEVKYLPKDARVLVRGGRPLACKEGRCSIEAEEGSKLTINFQAEGHEPQKIRLEARENLTPKTVRLLPRFID